MCTHIILNKGGTFSENFVDQTSHLVVYTEGGGGREREGGTEEAFLINIAQTTIRGSHKIWVTRNWTDSDSQHLN